jgi:hypothetical protein
MAGKTIIGCQIGVKTSRTVRVTLIAIDMINLSSLRAIENEVYRVTEFKGEEVVFISCEGDISCVFSSSI